MMEQDELRKMYVPDVVFDLIAMNPNSGSSESNNSKQRSLSGDDSTPDQSRNSSVCTSQLQLKFLLCKIHIKKEEMCYT
jgi:hypothetical protein